MKIEYPFAAVPNQVIRGGIGAINLAVLCALLSRGESTCSATTLSKELGISRTSFFSAIKFWKENGDRFGVQIFSESRAEKGETTIYKIIINRMDGGRSTGEQGGVQSADTPVQQVNGGRSTGEHKEEPLKNNPKRKYPTPLPPPTDQTDQNAIAAPSGAMDGVNTLMAVFYDHGNTGIKFGNKTIRKDAEWLIQKYGLEQSVKLATWACSIQGQPYAPLVGTPTQLREKLLALQAFAKRNSESKVITI